MNGPPPSSSQCGKKGMKKFHGSSFFPSETHPTVEINERAFNVLNLIGFINIIIVLFYFLTFTWAFFFVVLFHSKSERLTTRTSQWNCNQNESFRKNPHFRHKSTSVEGWMKLLIETYSAYLIYDTADIQYFSSNNSKVKKPWFLDFWISAET